MILYVVVLLIGCADQRGPVAREGLRQSIASQSGGALALSSMTETNGFDHEREGMKLHTIEWAATLLVHADGWKAGWRDFKVLQQPPNALAAAVEGLSVRRLMRGGTATIQGKSELQKADRGWRVLTSEVTAFKIDPPSDLIFFIGTWKDEPSRGVVKIELTSDGRLQYIPSSSTFDSTGRVLETRWLDHFDAEFSDSRMTVNLPAGAATFARVAGSDNELLLTVGNDSYKLKRASEPRVN